MLYYNGNLDEDLKSIENLPETKFLDKIGQAIGYGRCRQILQANEHLSEELTRLKETHGSIHCQEVIQILWAKFLRDSNCPISGALGPI